MTASTGTSFKHSGKYALYGTPPRWRLITAAKPAPKGAPISAHPHAVPPVKGVKHFMGEHWAAMNLPENDPNANLHNGQLAALRAQAESGNITGILGSSYGANTHGKKLAAVANHILTAYDSPHQVTPGQRVGEHPAVQTAPPGAAPYRDPDDKPTPEEAAAAAAEAKGAAKAAAQKAATYAGEHQGFYGGDTVDEANKVHFAGLIYTKTGKTIGGGDPLHTRHHFEHKGHHGTIHHVWVDAHGGVHANDAAETEGLKERLKTFNKIVKPLMKDWDDKKAAAGAGGGAGAAPEPGSSGAGTPPPKPEAKASTHDEYYLGPHEGLIGGKTVASALGVKFLGDEYIRDKALGALPFQGGHIYAFKAPKKLFTDPDRIIWVDSLGGVHGNGAKAKAAAQEKAKAKGAKKAAQAAKSYVGQLDKKPFLFEAGSSGSVTFAGKMYLKSPEWMVSPFTGQILYAYDDTMNDGAGRRLWLDVHGGVHGNSPENTKALKAALAKAKAKTSYSYGDYKKPGGGSSSSSSSSGYSYKPKYSAPSKPSLSNPASWLDAKGDVAGDAFQMLYAAMKEAKAAGDAAKIEGMKKHFGSGTNSEHATQIANAFLIKIKAKNAA